MGHRFPYRGISICGRIINNCQRSICPEYPQMAGSYSSEFPRCVIGADNQAGLVVFVGLIMGGFWVYRLYSHSSTVQTKPKSPDSKPSQEVQMLTAMFSSCIPLVVSGYLVCPHLAFLLRRKLIPDRLITTIRLHPRSSVKYHIRTTHYLFNEIRKTPAIP